MQPGSFYHIFNRANGFENLFREEKNYSFFLKKMQEHILPVAETFAWCLLANHFHLLVRFRTEEEIGIRLGKTALSRYGSPEMLLSKRFSNFFSCYTQSYNKVYKRKGSLFRPTMKKKCADEADYLIRLIVYIHNNAVKHGFVNNINAWPHSSWHQYIRQSAGIGNTPSIITAETKAEVFSWFGGREAFVESHLQFSDLRKR